MKKATPTGFPDVLPEKAQKKERIVQTIVEVYRRFGFVPLETPVVEFQDLLVGEQTDFNLFSVNSSRERQRGEGEPLAMRFDLTVPLSRVVAQYPELPKPFKRYQLGMVFRGERPQKGRYRQFAQLDADIVGSANIFADIEVITMMREVMRALELPKFTIKVNTRNILNALPDYASFDSGLIRPVLTILDKRDKISREELQQLLVTEARVDELAVNKLIEFGNIVGEPTEVVEQLQELFKQVPSAQKGLLELAEIASALATTTWGTDNIVFDMSIIRGLAYYTGPVFETVLDDVPELGSVYSGGRYDELIGKLLDNGQLIPAVGASVGVDRLLAVLEELETRGLVKPSISKGSIVLVQDESVFEYAFAVANKIRSTGAVCDLYLGKDINLSKQFGYAEGKNYELAYIVGERERENKTVMQKNLLTREQREITIDEL